MKDNSNSELLMSKKQEKKTKKRLQRYLEKIKHIPRVVKCDECNRLSLSIEDCFSLETCRNWKIPFRCGSCKFPQYRDTLCNPTRGNVGMIYGKQQNPASKQQKERSD